MKLCKQISGLSVVMMITAIAAIGAAAERGLAQYAPQRIEQEHRQILEVSATGEFEAEPDIARVVFRVIREAEEAEVAADQVAEAQRELVEALDNFQDAEVSVTTGRYWLNPIYEQQRPVRLRERAEDELPRIIGYSATATVIAETADLSAFGAVVAAGIDAGASSVERVEFDLIDRAAARAEAIGRATTIANQEAIVLAEAAGVEIGDPLRIRLEPGSQPYLYTARAESLATMAGGMTPPVFRPEPITISATVHIEFEFATE